MASKIGFKYKPNFNGKSSKNTPELVGATIRRDSTKANSNKSNFYNKQTPPNKPNSSNRFELQNRQSYANRPSSGNKQTNASKSLGQNKQNFPNRTGGSYKPGTPYRQGDLNKSGSKFNNQKFSGVRKPVSPNELMQLQKTNASDKPNIIK